MISYIFMLVFTQKIQSLWCCKWLKEGVIGDYRYRRTKPELLVKLIDMKIGRRILRLDQNEQGLALELFVTQKQKPWWRQMIREWDLDKYCICTYFFIIFTNQNKELWYDANETMIHKISLDFTIFYIFIYFKVGTFFIKKKPTNGTTKLWLLNGSQNSK